MSMNLNLEINGKAVNLYQTPTWVSNMCQVPLILEGDKRKYREMAVEIYCQWVEGLHTSGAFTNEEDYKAFQEAHSMDIRHTKEIRGMIKNAKTVEVWVM